MGEALAWSGSGQHCSGNRWPHSCDLHEQTAQLHDTVARLRSFNRSVSHDLRDPLSAVSGVMRLAMDAISRSDTARAMRLLSATAEHADTLSRLITDLLALAEADQSADEEVHLAAIVQDAIDQIALKELVHGRAMPPVRVGALPTVRGSAPLLRQVFVNLIGNALKFTRQQADPRIEVDVCPDVVRRVLFVRDNGVGFEPATASALFQPFHRLHGSAYDGSGVGLSIVRRIVERHGGEVWANGVPGAGATFFFTLGRPERPLQEQFE